MKRIVLVAAAVAAVASSTAGAAPLVKGPAYTWGLNTHGQLGLGYSSNDVNTTRSAPPVSAYQRANSTEVAVLPLPA